jgi:glycosyltransferase involved in cell wall biosynthesis
MMMTTKAVEECRNLGSGEPLASVIICTRNRADSLARTLDSIVRSTRDINHDCWEVVIVDNGSVDGTRITIDSFKHILPLRSVFAPEPGLSNARNAGLVEARGSFIIWTDDDVIVGPQWLDSYLRAFKSFPDTLIFGADVCPTLEPGGDPRFVASVSRLPQLMAERRFPFGHSFGSGEPASFPYGANFAIRSDYQRLHLYDPRIGAGSSLGLLGEETIIIDRILEETATRGRWVVGGGVDHIIGPSRQSFEYIWKYYYSQGRTVAFGRTHSRSWSIDQLLNRLTLAFSAVRYMASDIVRAKYCPRYYASLAFWSGRCSL